MSERATFDKASITPFRDLVKAARMKELGERPRYGHRVDANIEVSSMADEAWWFVKEAASTIERHPDLRGSYERRWELLLGLFQDYLEWWDNGANVPGKSEQQSLAV